MEKWLKESTRLFINDLLKEDLGLGHMVDDGQTKTVMVSPVMPKEPTVLDKIQAALKEVSSNKIDQMAERNLQKILNYLNTLR
jgi:hypothetical protein